MSVGPFRLPWSVACILAGCAQSGPTQPTSQQLDCPVIPIVQRAMLERHVSFHSMDAELEGRFRDAYLERLDPHRSLFTDAERASMLARLERINAEVGAGRCDELLELNERVALRYSAAAALARVMLSGEGSPDVPPVTTSGGGPDARMEDIRPLLERSVNRRLAEVTEMVGSRARELVPRMYQRVGQQLREDGERGVYAAYLEVFAEALDPGSAYLSPIALGDFQARMQQDLSGIGVSVSVREGAIVVERALPGGSAGEPGGLKAGDKIVAVAEEGRNPVYVLGWEVRDVVRLLRGPAGSRARLTILRNPQKREMQIALVRRPIDLDLQRARLSFEALRRGGGKKKLAVVTLPSLYGSSQGADPRCWEDVEALLRQAVDQEVDGLLLDLRGSSGGLIDAAVRVTSLFVGAGGVAATRDRRGHISILRDDDERVHFAGPVVVLTSRSTASGSELVAGALHDYQRAIIVGEGSTLGIGTVQSVQLLSPSIGAIKVTTSYSYRPSGVSPQAVGVASDIPLPALPGGVKPEPEESGLSGSAISAFLDQSAVTEREVARTSSAMVATLDELSRQRVAANPSFASPTPELHLREALEVLADLVQLVDDG